MKNPSSHHAENKIQGVWIGAQDLIFKLSHIPPPGNADAWSW